MPMPDLRYAAPEISNSLQLSIGVLEDSNISDIS